MTEQPKGERDLVRLWRENTILRGLVARHVKIPCVYCGLHEMAKCERGFPGCAKADDIICGEEEVYRLLRAQVKELQEKAESDKKYADFIGACHKLAVKERDFERVVNDRLRREAREQRERIERLETAVRLGREVCLDGGYGGIALKLSEALTESQAAAGQKGEEG